MDGRTARIVLCACPSIATSHAINPAVRYQTPAPVISLCVNRQNSLIRPYMFIKSGV